MWRAGRGLKLDDDEGWEGDEEQEGDEKEGQKVAGGSSQVSALFSCLNCSSSTPLLPHRMCHTCFQC